MYVIIACIDIVFYILDKDKCAVNNEVFNIADKDECAVNNGVFNIEDKDECSVNNGGCHFCLYQYSILYC